jgi:hypothetical protein
MEGERAMLGRIWARLLGAAGAVVVMLAVSAPTALAHPAAADVEVTANDQLVFPGGGSSIGLISVYFGDRRADLVTLDIDLSDVADFVEFRVVPLFDWECDTSGTAVHCEVRDEEVSSLLDYQVFGFDGFPPGHSGELRVTATVDGGTAQTTATITMAEPVDLASPDTGTSAAPGTTAGLPSQVRNIGPRTITGTVLTLETLDTDLLRYAGNFSNCTDYEFFIECAFDEALSPSTTHRLSPDVPYRVRPGARTGAVMPTTGVWWTAADWDRVDESWKEMAGNEGVPGTGAPLRLVEVGPGSARAVPQTDTDIFTNFPTIRVTVTGNNPADIAALGASGSGPVGTTVQVSLEAKNHGPAALADGHLLEVPFAYVSVPEGTTAVEVPFSCAPFTTLEDWNPFEDGGTPGADEYACRGDVAPAGGSVPYEFGFRVDEFIADATGAFRVDLAGDPNEANDTAPIVINPTADGNGGLPVTGASLGLVIGAGLLLLGLGAVLLVLVRRRQTVPGR